MATHIPVIVHTITLQNVNAKNILVQCIINTIKNEEGKFALYVDYIYPLKGSTHDVELEDAQMFVEAIRSYERQVDLIAMKY